MHPPRGLHRSRRRAPGDLHAALDGRQDADAGHREIQQDGGLQDSLTCRPSRNRLTEGTREVPPHQSRGTAVESSSRESAAPGDADLPLLHALQPVRRRRRASRRRDADSRRRSRAGRFRHRRRARRPLVHDLQRAAGVRDRRPVPPGDGQDRHHGGLPRDLQAGRGDRPCRRRLYRRSGAESSAHDRRLPLGQVAALLQGRSRRPRFAAPAEPVPRPQRALPLGRHGAGHARLSSALHLLLDYGLLRPRLPREASGARDRRAPLPREAHPVHGRQPDQLARVRQGALLRDDPAEEALV